MPPDTCGCKRKRCTACIDDAMRVEEVTIAPLALTAWEGYSAWDVTSPVARNASAVVTCAKTKT